MDETMFIFEVLLISSLLGIIPGCIAKNKGHNFFVWWIYGWMLFIVAIIHVMFIENLENPTTNKQINNSNNLEYSSADLLLKYKELLDSGIITQEEFDNKKKELL